MPARLLPAPLRIWFASLLVILAMPVLGQELTPPDVAQFFVEPDQPVSLQWTLKSGATAGEFPYRIVDYHEREVRSGKAKTTAAGTVQVELNLKPGYYEIIFPDSAQEFGIAALPAFSGDRDPFFAIDSAMSWLVRDDRSKREGLLTVLRRCGIGMSRERLAWRAISPSSDRWNWDTADGYETLRQAAAERGVEVLEMCHDTPRWLGLVGKYPADLAGTARQWKQITERWQATWGALEVWNEPDIFFGDNLPGDQYVPLVKATAYAADQAGFTRPVVGGVVAHFHQAFLDSCQANGMLESIDVLSFHTYARAPEMEPLVAKYRSWLRQHGHGGMPLWLTECGRPWSKGPSRPPLAEDANSGLDIVMKAVEARACAIDRHFPFVYPYYEENNNNFGMTGREGSPLRSMAGYAQFVRAVAHKRYLGDWQPLPESVVRARVFGDGHWAVLILYTGKIDAGAELTMDVETDRMEGLDGRLLQASAAGRVPVPDGLSYVWLPAGRVGERLNRQTAAMQLWPAAEEHATRRTPTWPVVLRAELQPQVMSAVTEGYRVKPDAAAELPVKVRVFNLSSSVEQTRIELQSPAAVLAGKRLQTIEIPAESAVNLAWTVNLQAALAEQRQAEFRLKATSTNGRHSSSLVMNFLPEKSAEKK